MRYREKIPTLFVVLFASLAVLFACDSGGMNDEPDVTIQAKTITFNGGLISEGVIVSRGDTVGRNGSGSFAVEPGQNVPVYGLAPGYVRTDTSVSVPPADRIGGSETISLDIRLREDLPDEVTITTETVNEDGSRIDTAAISYDGTTVGTGFAQKTYQRDADKSISIEVGGNGLTQADTSVGLGSNHSLEFVLRKEVPKQVTVSFENRAANGDSLVAGDIQLAGELKASDKKSGSFTTAGSRASKQLCFTEGEFFRRYCQTISLMKDQSVELFPERKEVTVATTPMDSTGTILSDALVFVGPDSVEITGNGSIKRPKRSGTRTIVGDWITKEADSDKLNRYRSQPITVSAAENIDREIVIDQLIPACSDKVDNDGDGAVDKADTIACTDMDGNYDPSDDNEVLNGHSRVTGRLFDDSVSVSKTAGKRVAKISAANNPLPWSVTVAKGEIKHAIEVQRSDTIPNQAHATHLKTGRSNDNLTVAKTSDVTADADTANGFVWIRVHGIDRSFFADGPYYAVYGWHGCKALGNCDSIDGSGKFYYYAELQNGRGHSWSYVFEPEEVPKDKQQSISKQAQVPPATLEVGECREISATDELCRVPAGQAEAF